MTPLHPATKARIKREAAKRVAQDAIVIKLRAYADTMRRTAQHDFDRSIVDVLTEAADYIVAEGDRK